MNFSDFPSKSAVSTLGSWPGDVSEEFEFEEFEFEEFEFEEFEFEEFEFEEFEFEEFEFEVGEQIEFKGGGNDGKGGDVGDISGVEDSLTSEVEMTAEAASSRGGDDDSEQIGVEGGDNDDGGGDDDSEMEMTATAASGCVTLPQNSDRAAAPASLPQ
jgi:hypothetical protein